MRIWLTEKPSFAKDLAQALGGQKRNPHLRNCWESYDGRVVAAVGHLLELQMPEDYNPAWAEWNVAQLPIIPPNWLFKYRPIAEKEQVIKGLELSFKGATEIIIATDAGREGEYIAWTILDHLGLMHLPKKRLWSSGANVTAIARAVKTLKDYEEKAKLADAARVRAESDWIEGLNLTRLFSIRHKPANHQGVISLGRVQTATLAIIVRRQSEIDSFVSSRYYDLSIEVNVAGHKVILVHSPKPPLRITNVVDARGIANAINHQPVKLNVEMRSQRHRPPSLFESSSLQIRAYNLWGWPASKTEVIAQSLYDVHKIISYPRTDGIHLEEEQWGDVPIILRHLTTLQGVADVQLRKNGETFVDLLKVFPTSHYIQRGEVFSSKLLAKSGADHHGIIPTVEPANFDILTNEEKQLYLLIVRQFLAQLMVDCEYDQRRVSLTTEGRIFSATGRTITKPGWTRLFGAADRDADSVESEHEQEQITENMPPISNGAVGAVSKSFVIEKQTIAPPHFSEATLIGAMRDLTRVVTDEEALQKVKVARTIGTKSTWPDTIKKLRERQYVTGYSKIIPTNLGVDIITVCQVHVPTLIDVTATAVLELLLCEIEKGERSIDVVRAAVQRRNIVAINTFKAVETIKLRSPGTGGKNNPAKATPRPFKDFPEGSWKLTVPYDDREKVKTIGAKFNGDTKTWHVSKNIDINMLREKGWLAADT